MTEMPTRLFHEVWEITIPGTVWVSVVNERGRERDVQVGGRGGRRLRITPMDRELAQERVVDPENDPFINGMLVRIDNHDPDREPHAQELPTETLVGFFTQDTAAFIKTINGLSQVNVRRMKDMCDAVDASGSQTKAIDDLIAQKWPITSGDTPVYRELKEAEGRGIQG